MYELSNTAPADAVTGNSEGEGGRQEGEKRER